jgi:hypothetical protein
VYSLTHSQRPSPCRCPKNSNSIKTNSHRPSVQHFVIGPDRLLPPASPPYKPSSSTRPGSGPSDKTISRMASTMPWRPISQTR